MKQEIKDKMEEILRKHVGGNLRINLRELIYEAMEEYASKGMRWVKASERLPKNNRKNIFRYLGNHYRKGDTFQSTEIGKGLIQFIEWLEESPNKSSVASSQHKPHVESVEAGKADKDQRIK